METDFFFRSGVPNIASCGKAQKYIFKIRIPETCVAIRETGMFCFVTFPGVVLCSVRMTLAAVFIACRRRSPPSCLWCTIEAKYNQIMWRFQLQPHETTRLIAIPHDIGHGDVVCFERTIPIYITKNDVTFEKKKATRGNAS